MKWMKTVLCNEVLVVFRWVVILNGIHIKMQSICYAFQDSFSALCFTVGAVHNLPPS